MHFMNGRQYLAVAHPLLDERSVVLRDQIKGNLNINSSGSALY